MAMQGRSAREPQAWLALATTSLKMQSRCHVFLEMEYPEENPWALYYS
jgi:hypothetical protein